MRSAELVRGDEGDVHQEDQARTVTTRPRPHPHGSPPPRGFPPAPAVVLTVRVQAGRPGWSGPGGRPGRSRPRRPACRRPAWPPSAAVSCGPFPRRAVTVPVRDGVLRGRTPAKAGYERQREVLRRTRRHPVRMLLACTDPSRASVRPPRPPARRPRPVDPAGLASLVDLQSRP